MTVFCKNYNCPYIEMLETPIRFSFRKNHYIPLEEDGYCMGRCKKNFPGFAWITQSTNQVMHKMAVCPYASPIPVDVTNTCKAECLWNKNGECTRGEILVDKEVVGDKTFWVCRCHSDIAISGHMDWSRFGKKKDLF
jgi:hypothetical protein